MTEHDSHKINKALRKRFLLLCPSEFVGAYKWFLIRMIGYQPYRGGQPPKITGDADLVRAWRAHCHDIICVYAPRVKLQCGHKQRSAHCMRCLYIAIKQYEAIKAKREGGK